MGYLSICILPLLMALCYAEPYYPGNYPGNYGGSGQYGSQYGSQYGGGQYGGHYGGNQYGNSYRPNNKPYKPYNPYDEYDRYGYNNNNYRKPNYSPNDDGEWNTNYQPYKGHKYPPKYQSSEEYGNYRPRNSGKSAGEVYYIEPATASIYPKAGAELYPIRDEEPVVVIDDPVVVIDDPVVETIRDESQEDPTTTTEKEPEITINPKESA